jgi:hypothetical protein
LKPLLEGNESLNRDAIFWHFPHYHGGTWAPGAAIRAGDWKLIEFYEEETYELYNPGNDLSEKQDLSQTQPRKAEELRSRLRAWQKEVGAKLPTPNPHFHSTLFKTLTEFSRPGVPTCPDGRGRPSYGRAGDPTEA